MQLHAQEIRYFAFSTWHPFLAGLRLSEEGSVELEGEGRLLEELDPLLLSPYQVNGIELYGREEDRLATDALLAENSSSSLDVLFKHKAAGTWIRL